MEKNRSEAFIVVTVVSCRWMLRERKKKTNGEENAADTEMKNSG